MDGLTLFAAVLVGSVGTAGVGLLAVSLRHARSRARRRDSRTGARPGPARPAPKAGKRPKEARSRPPIAPRPALPPMQALGGETLQLGPVPAWKLPAEQPVPVIPASRRNGSTPARDERAAERAEPSSLPRRGGLFWIRRGEYASSAALNRAVEEETVPDLRANEPRASGGEPRNDRDGRAPSVVTNASRRHDPRTAAGRATARQ